MSNNIIQFPLSRYYENKGYEFNKKLDELNYAYETYMVYREHTDNLEEVLNFSITFENEDINIEIVEDILPDTVKFSGVELEEKIFALKDELEKLESDIILATNSDANLLMDEAIYSFYNTLLLEIDIYICNLK